ncbi:hypothetical protein [Clostridium sp. VAP52]|uniref:hypothetical protein n=1 Tax=Clostridium sp. VAP52 TaxID=2949977 RepID=UPI00207AD047|nr:hypothetical protein [Clostridium sp. VAP52]
MNKRLKGVQATLKTYSNLTDKSVNITYMTGLEELDINDLDKNICTINIKNNLSKTDKIELLACLCKDLNIEIEHFRINSSMFLSCLKSNCFSALMLDDKKITITSQDFELLLILHEKITTILTNKFSYNIEKSLL